MGDVRKEGYQRVVYYEDPVNDDFAKNKIKKKPLPKRFKWTHKGPIWNFFAYILYYLIALPILWAYTMILYQPKFVGKKKLKKAHVRKGYFVYGNHTQNIDGFISQIFLCFPHRAYVVTSQEAFSLPGIRWLLQMLGVIPVSDTPEGAKSFIKAIEYRHHRGDPIIIFPEAHIWPYATVIRPFPEASFSYPAQLNAPVVAICTTYKKRKLFRHSPPRPIIHVSDPIYPNPSLPLGERTKALRDAAYEYMVETSSSLDNYEYIRYMPKKKKQ